MSLTIPALNRRQTIGAPLSIPQVDANWDTIAAFVNTLAGLIGASLNPDGTLVDNSVGANALKDRIVGANNLKADALPFFVDGGTTNAYSVTPTPALTAYTDKMVFFVVAGTTNTGASTFSAIAGLPALPIVKLGGTPLQAGDIQAHQLFVVGIYGGQALLLGGTSSSSSSANPASTANFTGLTRFDPAAFALPGNGASTTLAHGFTTTPQTRAYLLCQTADGTFNPGDVVPLSDVEDSGTGKQAFIVKSNTSNIVVAQTTATLAVGGTGITAANWLIQINAYITFNEATRMFPAVEVTAARPDGAVSYGQYLFYFGRANSSNSATYAHRLDTQTGKIKLLNNSALAQNFSNVNIAIFRNNAGQDVAVWTCSTGTYHLNLQDPNPTAWTPTRDSANTFGGDLHKYKPVVYDETSNTIYAIASSHQAQALNAIKLVKIPMDGTACSFVGATAVLNLTPGNSAWASVLGANKAEFAAWYPANANPNIILFQYNPILKRIYLMTEDMAAIHIFDITAMVGLTGKSIDFWTWYNQTDAARMATLTYQKTIALGGSLGLTSGNNQFDRPCIEFDLTTGLETAIAMTKNADLYSGAVVRVPWLELA